MGEMSQSCLYDEPLKAKNSGHKAQVSFPGWPCSLCIVIHQCWKTNLFLTPGEQTCGTSPVQYALPLVDFNLYPFPIINPNPDNNGFQ